MANRNIHYEAAFEDYLRARGVPYVAVDEAKKASFGKISLKSFDFIVYSQARANLLIDVKGRKFPDSTPGGKKTTRRAWENWVTRDDIEGLQKWSQIFGESFCPVLLFAYWLQGPPERSPFEEVHFFRDRSYGFVAIPLGEYIALARPRSTKWQTLDAPSGRFATAARDVASFL
jgi:hypothetical protein